MQTVYLSNLRPIDEFIRTDDDIQPELVIETESGLYFYGSWDPDSGYFSIWELLFEPETEEQEKFVEKMELPGRLYANVVKFQYL